MMIEEFEQRTGYYPTAKEYEAIEKAYTDFSGDKDAFCKAFRKNEEGIAEKIQHEVNVAAFKDKREQAADITRRDIEIERLKKQLEREQEWKPYESENNVKQADYERLASSVPNGAYYMTDEEAKDWICSEFDFDRDKITILHEVDEEEINRHRQCRKTGRKIDRRPVYCATDYHYIRFNTSRWYYEVWNDSLRPFFD
nr:MAG TPA: hypothetical protein [Caudoviricetes sp.]